jgi:hypothetical protein
MSLRKDEASRGTSLGEKRAYARMSKERTYARNDPIREELASGRNELSEKGRAGVANDFMRGTSLGLD